MKWWWIVGAFLLSACGAESKKEVETTSDASWQMEPTTFEIQQKASDLIIPWDLKLGPDGRLWFTEKHGWIKAMDTTSGRIDTLLYIPDVFVSAIENSGLHSFCFHPQWPDSSVLFCHYTYDSLASKIVRYEYVKEQDELINPTPLFPHLAGARSHNGSRMEVGEDGMIYCCIGDAYLFDPAQQDESLNGKVLRFQPDGGVPADNPIPGNYLWSKGHRNPQGMAFGRNGQLYCSEHGTNTDDELNRIEKGGNCGWPNVLGRCDLPVEEEFCRTHELVYPLFTWTPTAAPSGLAYYDHPAIPEFRNCLLQAFLKDKSIGVMQLDEAGGSVTEKGRFFTNVFYRVRDIEVLPDGSLFICSSNKEVQQPAHFEGDDHIYRIKAHNGSVVKASATDEAIVLDLIAPELVDSVSLTTFWGGSLESRQVAATDHSLTLNWVVESDDPHFLRFDLKDGRILLRRLFFTSAIE